MIALVHELFLYVISGTSALKICLVLVFSPSY